MLVCGILRFVFFCLFVSCPTWFWGFPGGASGKNPPANTGDTEDTGSNPDPGRSPGGEHGNSPQYSHLETPIDRGAWGATVHGVESVGYGWATEHTHSLNFILFHQLKINFSLFQASWLSFCLLFTNITLSFLKLPQWIWNPLDSEVISCNLLTSCTWHLISLEDGHVPLSLALLMGSHYLGIISMPRVFISHPDFCIRETHYRKSLFWWQNHSVPIFKDGH